MISGPLHVKTVGISFLNKITIVMEEQESHSLI